MQKMLKLHHSQHDLKPALAIFNAGFGYIHSHHHHHVGNVLSCIVYQLCLYQPISLSKASHVKTLDAKQSPQPEEQKINQCL